MFRNPKNTITIETQLKEKNNSRLTMERTVELN